MNYLIVIFFLSLLSTNNLLSWIIPYSLDVNWNKGNRTYLLVGSHHAGPLGHLKINKNLKIKLLISYIFKGMMKFLLPILLYVFPMPMHLN